MVIAFIMAYPDMNLQYVVYCPSLKNTPSFRSWKANLLSGSMMAVFSSASKTFQGGKNVFSPNIEGEKSFLSIWCLSYVIADVLQLYTYMCIVHPYM